MHLLAQDANTEILCFFITVMALGFYLTVMVKTSKFMSDDVERLFGKNVSCHVPYKIKLRN